MLLAVATLLAGSTAARAQSLDLLTGATALTPARPSAPPMGSILARGQAESYQAPGLPLENVPTPLGNPGTHGFYTIFEFLMLTQSWTVGDQTVAFRGLVDSRGLITGLPGTYIGSGVPALSTKDFPRRTWQPGFTVGLGYKFDNGLSVYATYTHLFERDYHAGASLASPFFRSKPDLSDTFLVAGVFNFPPQFAGPPVKTSADTNPVTGGGNFYGIWNGAATMDIQFNQWFNQAEIGARVPLFQTEYSRIYGLAGGRFNMFMERFIWRTVDYDINGNSESDWAADYNNTLSQRMYGPFIGCGHEVWLGKRMSVSLDVTAAALLNVIKERAKYELRDQTIANKLSRDELGFVPSFTANLNVWWYPIEGVQIRAGYNAWTFFNTMNMDQPIGFNYGAIDPAYNTQVFRLLHGVNVGLGLFF
jgi:hypothetical protein